MSTKTLVFSLLAALVLGGFGACALVNTARDTAAVIGEKHCGYFARTDARIEEAERGDGEAAGQGHGVGACAEHGPQGAAGGVGAR